MSLFTQAINPNAKFPAIVDSRGDAPISVWESAAILIHLAEVAKSDLLPTEVAARAQVMTWVIFQAANIGPCGSSIFHFLTIKKSTMEDYPVQRSCTELKRLFGVLDGQLAKNAYIAGEKYSLADIISFHWVEGFFGFLPHVFPDVAAVIGLTDPSNSKICVRGWERSASAQQ
jgi:GST-like protein